MDYSLYNSDGRIVAVVGATQDELPLYISSYGAAGAIDGAWSWDKFFVREQRAEAFPDRPSPAHSWSWSSLEWRDERSIEQLKSEKLSEMRDARDGEIFGGFSWDGSRFDSDHRSQVIIESMFNDARLGHGEELVNFRLADNTWRALGANDKLALGRALRTHVRDAFDRFAAIERRISECRAAPDVEAIVWPNDQLSHGQRRP